MSYVATAFVRTDGGWAGREVELDGVEDLDGFAELVADTGSELGGDGPVVLMLEEDEEYVAVVRGDGESDVRVFVSDGRVTATSRIAAVLGEDLEVAAETAAGDEDEDDATSSRPEVESAGDEALLADLGITGDELEKLCATEGMLPADVIYALCERLGCAELLDEIRGL